MYHTQTTKESEPRDDVVKKIVFMRCEKRLHTGHDLGEEHDLRAYHIFHLASSKHHYGHHEAVRYAALY